MISPEISNNATLKLFRDKIECGRVPQPPKLKTLATDYCTALVISNSLRTEVLSHLKGTNKLGCFEQARLF